MDKKQTKILITGGGGYIGSVLAKILLDEGFPVTVLDNFMYGQSSLMDCCSYQHFDVIRGDCRDEKLLQRTIKNKDIIIPLAALVGAPLCSRDEIGARTINFEAVRLLCKLTSSFQWILFPVTNSGYGVGEEGKLCTENSPLRPISLYGETKIEAEKCILDRGNVISFRLATAVSYTHLTLPTKA